jgi:hypothetical protein
LATIHAVGEKTVLVKWLQDNQTVAKNVDKNFILKHFPRSTRFFFRNIDFKTLFQWFLILTGLLSMISRYISLTQVSF